jgi:predicted PurR-regulated permease PerM
VRVRLPASFALRVAATALGTLALLAALQQARTVLHWLVTAAVAALLLDGPVRSLVARSVPRLLAVALVTVVAVVGAALLTYGVVDAVVEQYGHLSRTAPAAAADLSRTGPFPELWQRVRLLERTNALLEQAPERLFGSPASAARTAAARLGEVVLVLTLTVFLLVTYERFEARLLRLAQQGVAWRWSGIDLGVGAGASRARLLVARVLVLGTATAVVAQVVDVPAPVALGLWMAWWRLLPVLGVVVGYAPVVLLLVTDQRVVIVVAALLVLAAVEGVVAEAWHRSTQRSPLPMGFLVAMAFGAGFEMAGATGSVVAVVLAHLAVGVLADGRQPALPQAAGQQAPSPQAQVPGS